YHNINILYPNLLEIKMRKRSRLNNSKSIDINSICITCKNINIIMYCIIIIINTNLVSKFKKQNRKKKQNRNSNKNIKHIYESKIVNIIILIIINHIKSKDK
nr:hypothetical protein (CYb-COII intergenic region) - Leishmania tarentolae mitochondrion [Leishmania tarentolae]